MVVKKESTYVLLSMVQLTVSFTAICAAEKPMACAIARYCSWQWSMPFCICTLRIIFNPSLCTRSKKRFGSGKSVRLNVNPSQPLQPRPGGAVPFLSGPRSEMA